MASSAAVEIVVARVVAVSVLCVGVVFEDDVV